MCRIWVFSQRGKGEQIEEFRNNILFETSCKIQTLIISKNELDVIGDNLWDLIKQHGVTNLYIKAGKETVKIENPYVANDPTNSTYVSCHFNPSISKILMWKLGLGWFDWDDRVMVEHSSQLSIHGCTDWVLNHHGRITPVFKD